MIVSYHPLILVAVIIGGRADAVPARTRRVEDLVPVDGLVGAYKSSLVNISTEAQKSAESVEGGADKDQSLEGLNGFPFGSSNEAVKLLEVEANAIAGYDGEGQFNVGNTHSEYNLETPSVGFGYGNPFMAAAKASASVEVQTVEKNKPKLNGYEVTQSPYWNPKNDNPKKSLAQSNTVSPKGHNNKKNWYPYTRPAEGETFVQANGKIPNSGQAEIDTATQTNGKSQYHEETRPNSVLQTSKGLEVTVANADAGAKKYTEYGAEYNGETQPYLIDQITTGSQNEPSTEANVEIQSNGGFQYSGENKLTSSTKADAQAQANIGSSYSGESPHNWGGHYLEAAQTSGGTKYGGAQISDTGPLANGYEVTRSPYWNVNPKKSLVQSDIVSPNGHNNIKKWYPYTRPAEGETFVQADGEIENGGQAEVDTATQANGKFQYQEETQANSVVQTCKGFQVNVANADAVAKTYTGHGAEYNAETQSHLIGQINNGSQHDPSTETDVEVQPNGGFQYSEENKVTSSAKADAQPQANTASSYSGGSPHNWGAHYLAAAQTSGGTKYGGAHMSDTGPLANGYEVTRSPYWHPQKENSKKSLMQTDIVSPNGHNNTKNRYPYTRPVEGETVVQADEDIRNGGKAEADTTAQGNGKSQYQEETQVNSMVQTSNGLKVTVANAAANTYTGYGGKYYAETQPNSIDQINSGSQYEPFYPIRRNSTFNGGFHNSSENKLTSSAKADAQAQANAASLHSRGTQHDWGAHYLAAAQTTGGTKYGGAQISDTGSLANGYEVTRSPYWNVNPKKTLVQSDIVTPNDHNNIKKWYPYTRPAEGETFVQANGEIQNGGQAEVDTAAQENAKSQYQEETPANSVAQTHKGSKVTVANADAAANTYIGYGGQYNAATRPNSISQINSGIQYETFYPIRRNSTFNGGFHYSAENKLISSAKADAQAQANIGSSYSGGSPHNWGAHYLAAAQTSKNIKYGDAQISESAVYGNTNKYNTGYLNGAGFQANSKSYLENGAQFGAALGAATVVQTGPIIDTRFGETTHPSRRPQPHHGFRHPRSGWNYG